MTTRLSAPAASHTTTIRQGWVRRGRNRCAALGFACALLLVGPAGASASVFLELPGVPGDSTVAGFENQIELNSFQFGLTNPVQMGTDKAQGKPSFSDITVSKRLDKSSPSESISLSYGTIVQSYTQQAAGGLKEEVFTSGWDVIGNLQFADGCK
jgi:hypothetical protein